MEINVNALLEQLQNQRSALIFYKNAGVITEREYINRFKEIQRISKLHDRALANKEKFLPDVRIVTNYSL